MVLSNLGDSDLITSYINGNEKAFETLLLRHKDRVYRYIYSKLKDGQLSNDIFQDTFVKVVNTIKRGNYNEEGKFLIVQRSHKDKLKPGYWEFPGGHIDDEDESKTIHSAFCCDCVFGGHDFLWWRSSYSGED